MTDDRFPVLVPGEVGRMFTLLASLLSLLCELDEAQEAAWEPFLLDP